MSRGTANPNRSASGGQQWLPLRGDQLFLAAAVVCCLAAIGWYWLRLAGGEGMIEIDRAEPLQATFQVDVNQALWFELAQIPDIGETIGRRIVAEREARGPFADHDDLRLRVRGIGPKTLENIRPYLRPMPVAATIVEDDPRRLPSG